MRPVPPSRRLVRWPRQAPAAVESGGPAGARPARAWVPVLFGLLALGLLPWALWLTQTLPSRHLSHHWNLAWGGFDLALALAQLATATAALRRSAWLEGAATATGTLLLVDAWFDVLTSGTGAELALALGAALLVEIPLALLSFWIARDSERFLARLQRCLDAIARLGAPGAQRRQLLAKDRLGTLGQPCSTLLPESAPQR